MHIGEELRMSGKHTKALHIRLDVALYDALDAFAENGMGVRIAKTQALELLLTEAFKARGIVVTGEADAKSEDRSKK